MDLGRISQALQGYTGQQDSMENVTAVLQEELGPNWTETVFQDLQSLPPALKENLTHAFNYYAATMAWNELQEYLADPNLKNTPEIQDRLPILQHWMDFFGAPGQEAYRQLNDRLNALVETEPVSGAVSDADGGVDVVPETSVNQEGAELEDTTVSEDVPMEEIPLNNEVNLETGDVIGNDVKPEEASEMDESEPTSESEGEPKEEVVPELPADVFEIEKLQKELALLDTAEAWLSARCIQLKNIEVYAYPFYGFVVDLLRQILKHIESIEQNEILVPYIDQVFEGGATALQNRKESVKHEIELAEQNCESAQTALISDDTDMDEVRRTLGTIDTSDTVEYIGPAPDGFELLDDNTPLDESTIKEQYEKLENADALTGEKQEKTDEPVLEQENTSQTPQKVVQKKMSFSLKKKKPEGTT